jgi:hypothetical protein
MLAGTHENKFVPVELPRLRCVHIQKCERDITLCGRLDDAGHARRGSQAKERAREACHKG